MAARPHVAARFSPAVLGQASLKSLGGVVTKRSECPVPRANELEMTRLEPPIPCSYIVGLRG